MGAATFKYQRLDSSRMTAHIKPRRIYGNTRGVIIPYIHDLTSETVVPYGTTQVSIGSGLECPQITTCIAYMPAVVGPSPRCRTDYHRIACTAHADNILGPLIQSRNRGQCMCMIGFPVYGRATVMLSNQFVILSIKYWNTKTCID